MPAFVPAAPETWRTSTNASLPPRHQPSGNYTRSLAPPTPAHNRTTDRTRERACASLCALTHLPILPILLFLSILTPTFSYAGYWSCDPLCATSESFSELHPTWFDGSGGRVSCRAFLCPHGAVYCGRSRMVKGPALRKSRSFESNPRRAGRRQWLSGCFGGPLTMRRNRLKYCGFCSSHLLDQWASRADIYVAASGAMYAGTKLTLANLCGLPSASERLEQPVGGCCVWDEGKRAWEVPVAEHRRLVQRSRQITEWMVRTVRRVARNCLAGAE